LFRGAEEVKKYEENIDAVELDRTNAFIKKNIDDKNYVMITLNPDR
jgi:predicted Zn-dependent peptidase